MWASPRKTKRWGGDGEGALSCLVFLDSIIRCATERILSLLLQPYYLLSSGGLDSTLLISISHYIRCYAKGKGADPTHHIHLFPGSRLDRCQQLHSNLKRRRFEESMEAIQLRSHVWRNLRHAATGLHRHQQKKSEIFKASGEFRFHLYTANTLLYPSVIIDDYTLHLTPVSRG